MFFIKDLRRWRANNRSISELNNMTTRELRDLGVTRNEIPYAVRGTQ